MLDRWMDRFVDKVSGMSHDQQMTWGALLSIGTVLAALILVLAQGG